MQNDIDMNGALVAEQLEMQECCNQSPELYSPVLYKFTNDQESPYLDSLLAMFYQGAYDNQLGIMKAFNIETEEEELILVGVDADENNKPVCYPLAKILAAEDVKNYLSPDGKGGWFDERDPSAAAEAREGMRSINEAIVE